MNIKERTITTELSRLQQKYEIEKQLYITMLDDELICHDVVLIAKINKTKTKIATLKWVLQQTDDD